jgi:hypothetical protein
MEIKKEQQNNIISKEYSILNNYEPLKKSILIKNYDVNKIVPLIKDVCIRHNMYENNEYIIYPNQKLFYYLKYDDKIIEESNTLRFIVVYTLNNSINIMIHDYMTIKSKWFDNFSYSVIYILENNEIKYEEITY